MAFWHRRLRKIRPSIWIGIESQHIRGETRILEVKRDSLNVVRHQTTEAVMEAAAPTYQAIGRLAGRIVALKGLASHQRVHGSLDGHLLQEVLQLNDYVLELYRDYQQSLGLALFFPDENCRLLPPGFTGNQYAKALGIGADAQAKFVEYWRVEGPRYSDGQGGPSDAYQELMTRYTVETGRQASRLSTDRPPDDIVPPYTVSFEFRDGTLHRSEEDK